MVDRYSIVLITVFVLLTTLLARHFGWLNDDALNYLTLAEHVNAGQGLSLRPSWGNAYWAVFPAGYPAMVAACMRAFSLDAVSASKLANGCLLFSSIMLSARWLKLPVLLCASLFFSAALLEIASFSWSENSFIFAQLLAVFAFSLYLERGRYSMLLMYAGGLLLAAASRYIGGFMLAGYMLLQGLFFITHAYPRQRIVACMGVTLVCAGLFGLYLYMNEQLTGFTTGMARMPAQETLPVLFGQFGAQLFFSLWLVAPPLLLLHISGAKFTRPHLRDYPLAWSPLFIGGFYLLLLFILRSQSHFEQFSPRLLTPGTLLLYLGVLHMLCKNHTLRSSASLSILFSLVALLNLAITYKDLIIHPQWARSNSMEMAWQRFHARYDPLPDGSVLIAAGISYNDPTLSWNVISPIFNEDRIFYALIDDVRVSEKQYRAYLQHLHYKGAKPAGYWFDFSGFANAQALHNALAHSQVDPTLAMWIESHFQPHALVACKECNS